MNKIKQNKPIKKTNQEKILTIIFCLLLILVIILGIMFINTKNKNEINTKIHIAIPVLVEKSYNELSIDISNMKVNEENEYIFKIINYKGKDINTKELTYKMTFTKPSVTNIKLYKNDEAKNLLTDQSNLELLDNKLNKNRKEDDIYHLIIKNTKKVSKDSKITIKIES